MLGDIQNPRWLYIKACLLLMIGVLASALLLIDSPALRTAALLAAAVWGFCRAYYFAFYVVEKYADPGFRFAGLIAFARYALAKKKQNGAAPPPVRPCAASAAETPNGVVDGSAVTLPGDDSLEI
jgi:hypothetical protein